MNKDFNYIISLFSDYINIFGKSWMITLFLGVIFYFLGAYAIFNISNKIGLKASFISFFPFLKSFALGRIAEKYIKRNGSKSAKLSIILFIFSILQSVLLVAFVFSTIYALFNTILNIEDAIANDIKVTIDMFSSFVAVIILFFILLVCAICYRVFFGIVIWRVYAIFDYKMATIYTIISVVFSFVSSILLFIIRNNAPDFNYESRAGYFDIEQE